MSLQELHFYIAMAGTVAFASSAVLALADRKIDLFTGIVLGLVTAVGGGTIRDLILDEPVFWASEVSYLWVALVTSVVTFLASGFFERRLLRRLFLYIDAFAVAMFAVEATTKVWRLDFGLPIAPIILGVVTAIGGGLIRDVLVGRPTLLLSRDLYAIPVLIGCVVMALVLAFAPEYQVHGSIVCMIVTFGIRAAAIRWGLQVPEWATIGFKTKQAQS